MLRDDRIGEKRLMKCGLEAEITTYKNNKDINVKFEDGSIREHVRYDSFLAGTIVSPSVPNMPINSTMALTSRIGETRTMSCGLDATIIAYRNTDDIDIKFSNGIIREHVRYYRFKLGTLMPDDSYRKVIAQKIKDGTLKTKPSKKRNKKKITQKAQKAKEQIKENKTIFISDNNQYPHLTKKEREEIHKLAIELAKLDNYKPRKRKAKKSKKVKDIDYYGEDFEENYNYNEYNKYDPNEDYKRYEEYQD